MYAFAVLMWEVLTEKKPFNWIKDEVTLCSVVHQGGRPDISAIPREYPDKIKNLIISTWDHNRLETKTAIECFAIKQRDESVLVGFGGKADCGNRHERERY